MTTQSIPESREKLIRVRAARRGAPVELRVQYEVSRDDAYTLYRIVSVEDQA
jgi:hypothetical protein